MTRTLGGYAFAEPPAEWWEQAAGEDQKAFLRVLFARRCNGIQGTRALRDRMLDLLGVEPRFLNSKACASLLIDMHKHCSPLLGRLELELFTGQTSLFEDQPLLSSKNHAQDSRL